MLFSDLLTSPSYDVAHPTANMSDAAAAPKPVAKKASKPKKPVEHPGFTVMITEAVVALKEVG